MKRARLPLDELLLIAQVERRTNPTITSYTFVDGIERREPPRNLATMIQGYVDQVFEAICDVIGLDFDAMQRFGDGIQGMFDEV